MSIFEGAELVRVARALAVVLHHGQVDKSGERYITHPMRVAGGMNTPEGQAAGLLHDVVEDTVATIESLRMAYIPESVLVAVDAVTHAPNEPGPDYIERIITAGPLAIDVKLADMADNLMDSRLARLDESVADRLRNKYQPRVMYLTRERARLYPSALPS